MILVEAFEPMTKPPKKRVRSRRLKRVLTRPIMRDAITRGEAVLRDVDHRTAPMRRLRDLIDQHTEDCGGNAAISEAERSIIRRASMIELQLEMMEQSWARDNECVATATQLTEYQRAANSLRRMLESLGLKRRAKDITPDLETYARTRATATDLDEVE